MSLDASKVPKSEWQDLISWIPRGSHVLDLGCGDGDLLHFLQHQHQCTGYGVELRDECIPLCIERGVSVIQQNLDHGLGGFADDSFDVVLQLETLQAMQHVEGILREIARVAREAIISFPNFGHWSHRLSLLRGRMPMSKRLPYLWYDTPNLRFSTLVDFELLATKVGFKIESRFALHDGKLIEFLPNLRGSLAVFRLKRM